MPYDILNWDDIEEYYTDAVLLGNGASIALHPCFGYNSLLQQARSEGHISQEIEELFEHFDTQDFEFLLRRIWQANIVNETLEIDESVTGNIYDDLRRALIDSVRDNHADFSDVNHHFDEISDFCVHFDSVVSLNYDITLYWAIQSHNESDDKDVFIKDCFAGPMNRFDYDWQRFREVIRNGIQGSTLVFYPHGNLLICTDQMGRVMKLSRNRDTQYLLDVVEQRWQSNEYAPLFVSEGDARQKFSAISRSPYLNTVYNEVLPNLGESITVYGWSFSDEDDHILDSLFRHSESIERVAVSVYTEGSGDPSQFCEYVDDKIRDRIGSQTTVHFFDSASEGAWIH